MAALLLRCCSPQLLRRPPPSPLLSLDAKLLHLPILLLLLLLLHTPLLRLLRPAVSGPRFFFQNCTEQRHSSFHARSMLSRIQQQFCELTLRFRRPCVLDGLVKPRLDESRIVLLLLLLL
jgi:hypothetical protein